MINYQKILQNKKFPIILGIVLGAIFLLFIFLEIISPVSCKGEEKVIVIEKGWGSGKIGQKLKDEKLIKSKWFFVFYVWTRGYNKHLQAGEYLLSPQMTLFQIADIVAKGEINPNWLKITIPEGWTNKQIEERLISLEVIRPENKLPKEKEGYLFPDTYYFYRNSDVDTVVQKMRDNFNKKVTEDLLREIEKQGKTLYEVLIMASILEKEVISDEDRAIVSGIFWRRLENNYPLESCATIAYILGVEKWRYSYEDTRIESSYNTYINTGLPPTPINNPGLSAIKAAIYPKYTDYNFFLTDPKTGDTIFSKTLEEHNQNKAEYLK